MLYRPEAYAGQNPFDYLRRQQQPRRKKPGFAVGRTSPQGSFGVGRTQPSTTPLPSEYYTQYMGPQTPATPGLPTPTMQRTPAQAGIQGRVTGTSAPITGTLMTPSAPGQNAAITDAQKQMMADWYRRMGITDPTAYQAIGQPAQTAAMGAQTPAAGAQGGIPQTLAQALQNLPQTLQTPPPGAIGPIPAGGTTPMQAGAQGDPSQMLMDFARQRMSPDWQALPQNIQDLMYQQDQSRVNEQLGGAQERLGQQASRIYGRRAGEGTGTAMANFAELERGAGQDLATASRDAQIRNAIMTMGGQEAMLPFLQSQAGMRAQQGEGAIGRGLESYWRQRAEEERGRQGRAGAMLGGANLMALLGMAPGQNYNLNPLMLLQGQY